MSVNQEDTLEVQRYPNYAILPGRGRVRIMHYEGNGYFYVLTNKDERVTTHRSRLTFIKK